MNPLNYLETDRELPSEARGSGEVGKREVRNHGSTESRKARNGGIHSAPEMRKHAPAQRGNAKAKGGFIF